MELNRLQEIAADREMCDFCPDSKDEICVKCTKVKGATVGELWEYHAAVRNALRRTAEHDKAMKEGRLVELPCKECFSEAGNNVYLIYCGEVVEVVHCGLSICPVSGNPYIALCAEDKIFPYREPDAEHDTDPTDWCANGCDVAAADFGKTVFLTRQEAEDALERGGEND